MLGAIIGDIAGSRFEFNNTRSTNFKLFGPGCNYTDDTIMTIAVSHAIQKGNYDFKSSLRSFGRKYKSPMGGYGGSFKKWLESEYPQPYDSFGNGSAMRVSACAKLAKNRQQALELAALSCMPTHNHPEGIKGAMAIADATWALLHGAVKYNIYDLMVSVYGYTLNDTCKDIRRYNTFNETCQVTVPQAVQAFLESTDFENAIKLSISIGGDSDTIAAMCGTLAEAFYGIPQDIETEAKKYLPEPFIDILDKEYQP